MTRSLMAGVIVAAIALGGPAIRTAATAATIERSWHEIDAAMLPEGDSSLEAFVLPTHEPKWLALRDEFAECLTLRGIGQIDKKTVARLRSHCGIESFPDLTELDVASARRLRDTRTDGWATAIELPAVRSLTPAAAAAVATCPLVLMLIGTRGLLPRGPGMHSAKGCPRSESRRMPSSAARMADRRRHPSAPRPGTDLPQAD